LELPARLCFDLRVLPVALAAAALLQPAIVWKPIAFPQKRRAETAQYAQRHYGVKTWKLVRPRVIVEHVTAGTSVATAYATFAPDRPDGELHELPGLCAHFVVDVDGTIYQLVSLTTMCRHTVGLNWTAIGIEHVGLSGSDVLRNPRQLDASLRLTAWLMDREGIALGNVIGHAESLTSSYHRERDARWRCQTHGDWPEREMNVYRARLAAFAQSESVPLGPKARRVTPHC
jgi:N-acetylmuramoyl-L-alanine amidase